MCFLHKTRYFYFAYQTTEFFSDKLHVSNNFSGTLFYALYSSDEPFTVKEKYYCEKWHLLFNSMGRLLIKKNMYPFFKTRQVNLLRISETHLV